MVRTSCVHTSAYKALIEPQRFIRLPIASLGFLLQSRVCLTPVWIILLERNRLLAKQLNRGR